MSQAKPIPRPAPLRPAARPHETFDSSVRMKSQPPVAMPSAATGLSLVQPRPTPPQSAPAVGKRPPPPLPVAAGRPSPPPLPSPGPPPRVAPALGAPPVAPPVAARVMAAPVMAAPVMAPVVPAPTYVSTPHLGAPKPAMMLPPLGVMPQPVVNPFNAAATAPVPAPRLRDEELPDALNGTARRRRMALLFAALALLAVGGTAVAAISSHF